jgi:hypothetical protein
MFYSRKRKIKRKRSVSDKISQNSRNNVSFNGFSKSPKFVGDQQVDLGSSTGTQLNVFKSHTSKQITIKPNHSQLEIQRNPKGRPCHRINRSKCLSLSREADRQRRSLPKWSQSRVRIIIESLFIRVFCLGRYDI